MSDAPQAPDDRFPSAPPAPYGEPPPPARGTDPFAIGAIVTAVLGLAFVAIVLAAMALARVRHTGQKGRGLASVALVVSGLWVLVIVAVVAAILFRSG